MLLCTTLSNAGKNSHYTHGIQHGTEHPRPVDQVLRCAEGCEGPLSHFFVPCNTGARRCDAHDGGKCCGCLNAHWLRVSYHGRQTPICPCDGRPGLVSVKQAKRTDTHDRAIGQPCAATWSCHPAVSIIDPVKRVLAGRSLANNASVLLNADGLEHAPGVTVDHGESSRPLTSPDSTDP